MSYDRVLHQVPNFASSGMRRCLTYPLPKPRVRVLQLIGYTTLLVLCLGPSALAGIAVMFLLIPVRHVVSSCVSLRFPCSDFRSWL